MFCCVFGSHLFFTNLLFFAIFFFSVGFSCLLCFLVNVVLRASFLTGLPGRGPFFFPPPALFVFFLSVLLHVLGPMSGSDVVGSVGRSHCGLPVAPWDWRGLGQTVLELHRLGPPESLHYQGTRSTIDYDGKALHFFLVQLAAFLFNFVCFLKEVLLPVSSTHAFPPKLAQICSSGRKEEPCGGSQDAWVLHPGSDAHRAPT